ncbi:MFS transporter [Metaclostridioides mangenotii]|uniref:MFS transporter n=1 Tax=Metaclostridioides mangenotii TaxID=1540 RepID=UPI00068A729A|nr:MFS transporter [Clostridioides mangenotii]
MEKNKVKTTIWSKEFILIMLINLLIFCSFQMLLPVLPVYVKSLGAADSIIGWIAGLSTIASILIRPFAGVALDKYGRKGVFFIGLCIVILATISYGWVSVVAMILFIRFIHGFGWGISSTSSSTIASDIIPKKRFGEGMGYFSLSSSLAMALAPTIGLKIIADYNFRIVSVVSSTLTIVALLLAFTIKYKKVGKENLKTDNSLVKSLKESSQNSSKGSFNESIEKPLKSKINLFEKSAVAPASVIFLITITYGSIVGFISIYANDLGIKNVGIYFAIYAISLLISRPFFGKLVDRYGFDIAVFPGLICLFLGIMVLVYANGLLMFSISGVLYGVGFGATQSSLQTMSVINAPKENIGAANATFFNGFDGGIGVGSVVAGIVASNIGYSKMYMYLSISIVLAFLIYFVFIRGKSSNKIENK